MNRDIFIKKIIEIDNSCIQYAFTNNQRYIQKEMDERNLDNIKELVILDEWDKVFPGREINISKIKEITNNKRINPFLNLYNINIDTLKQIYLLLSKTHHGIYYYDTYSSIYRDLKEVNKKTKGNNPKTNKIKEVMQIILDSDVKTKEYYDLVPYDDEETDKSDSPKGYKTLEYLNYLVKTLENKHFTKIQLYQNLLYELYYILKDHFYTDETNKKRPFSRKMIFSIVDKLIRYYFCETNTEIIKEDKLIFSTSIDFDKYTTMKYIYDYLSGLTLTHSTKGI